jgi:hypothetical protein
MRRERRQPTRREWEQIMSPRPVVRRILAKLANKPPTEESKHKEGEKDGQDT